MTYRLLTNAERDRALWTAQENMMAAWREMRSGDPLSDPAAVARRYDHWKAEIERVRSLRTG